ncbi:MAG: hypothetical protein HKN70_02485 [Gammaproteobacteria bacterium]|nr:hypothetical protein [Gammaproteobacteria bacterium]
MMSHETRDNDFDNTVTDDEGMTDTSVFDAEEIVRSIENVAAKRNSVIVDPGVESRRRFEALQEEKRLKEELRDLDDYDFDDGDFDD